MKSSSWHGASRATCKSLRARFPTLTSTSSWMLNTKQASNPMQRNWLGKLKVILSDAEDVIDEIQYKASRKQAIRAYGTTSSKMNRCLTNLRMLVFVECKNLTSLLLIIKHLTALKSLYIINCEKMDLMGGGGGDVQYLNLRLQILYIVQLPKLEVLPGWLLGSANTLRSLHIEKCGNLKALPEWLPTLKLLQTLVIIHCKELSSLQEGIYHMKTLRYLKIEKCHKLVTRLEDWSNIPGLKVLISKNAKDDEEEEQLLPNSTSEE
ncbi:disease resistance protein RGA2-like [Carya illinoinensis]|uniref:disease resistance protein RGA2-like n=1 Tax=Carya illinoinensis TaxID=32201 RepID=UPI001C726808|nr:disease resistance protein RGA2-like [Carya illinoinensis]